MAGKKSTTNKTIDKAFVGSEPIVAEITGRNDPQLTRLFNWYNYAHDISDGKPWLLQWMRAEKLDKDLIDAVRKTPDMYTPTTICWYARMALNGTVLASANIDYIKSRLEEIRQKYALIKAVEEAKEETPTNVISIQDRTKAKMDQILTFAEEEVVDAFMKGAGLSMYQFLQKYSCNPGTANYLRAFYIKSRDEMFCGDDQVKEAYGKELKKYQNFWQGVIDDIDRFVGNKKVVKVRKPKEIKVKPVGKLVEKLKFQKEDPTLKLVSALPQEIIGAKELWTYNTKDRKLTVFYATGPAGLAVKGTSIINFDVEKSETKRLRKPEGVLNDVLKAGKVAIRKIMPDLTTIGSKPNGRINIETILLRVIK